MGYFDDVMAESGPESSNDPFNPPPEKKRPWFDLEDVITAPVRGVVGAAKGAWNLADTLTADALPDWNHNPLGESKSIIGGFVEGAAHFTAGFIPFGGGLGFAGLLAKGASAASKIGRVAAASGLAGFVAFEGHEKRLSDLVESVPALQNPVTEFLASNAEDPELLGRLKNALEQAGMGALADGVILGVKAVAKGRVTKQAALEAGKTPEQATELADRAAAEVATPEAMIALERRAGLLEEEALLGETGVHELPVNMRIGKAGRAPGQFTPEEHAAFAADAKAKYPDLPQLEAERKLALDEGRQFADRRITIEGPPEGIPDRRTGAERRGAAAETKRVLGLTVEQFEAEKAAKVAPANPIAGVDATPAQARRAPLLRRLGLDDEKIKKFTDAYEEKGAAMQETLESGAGIPSETAFNPRKLPAADRLRLGLKAADLPMQNFRTPESANVLMRTVEDFFRTEMEADFKSLAPTTLQKMAEDGATKTAEMLGIADPAAYMAVTQVRAGRTLTALEDALPMVQSDLTILELSSQTVAKNMQQFRLVAAGEIKYPGGLNKAAIEFAESLQHMAGMEAAVKNQGRLLGRLLVSRKNKASGVEIPPELLKLAEDPVRLAQTLEDMGGMERVLKQMEKYEKALKIAGEEGGDAAIHKLSQTTVGRAALDMTTEAFMGSVLSSPQTWVVNAMSNTMSMLYLPLERALGSVMIRSSGGRLAPASELALQQPVVQESFAFLTSLKESLRDSFKMFKDSGWSPENNLTGTSLLDKGTHAAAITAENAGLASEGAAGAAVNWIGKAARTSMKILGGTDIVSKGTYYRSAARARLQTEAFNAGITNPVAVAEHVEKRLAQLVRDGQAYTSKAVIDRGVEAAKVAGLKDPEEIQKFVLDYYGRNFDSKLSTLASEIGPEADVATYTNRALPGTVTANIQNFVAQHPVLKLVAPFINTPMNLLKGAGQRADAVGVTRYIVGRVWPKTMPEMQNTANRFLRDMLSGDPRKAADAVGRISVGMGAATFFTAEALAGNITGHGPSDPQQRQALLDTGWQPYSFRVGDAYVSYARMDPFATFIGTSADMAEYMNHAEDVGDEDHATAISGLAIGMANNFTNKSYLTGFANLVGAMQAPEKKLPEFFRRQASAFVPNILGTAGYGVGQDPNLREVRSFADAIMAKIPGLSQKLPPRRNILGEPLERPAAVEGKSAVLGTLVNPWDPIKYSRVKDDVVRNELAALGHAWEPPKRRTNGLDLMDVPAGKTNAYDRWQELQGSISIGGSNLKAALRRKIKSPEYRRLTAESENGLESPRVGELNKIIGNYRSAAWRKLLKEVPALKTHDTAFTANRHRVRAGLPAAIIPGL